MTSKIYLNCYDVVPLYSPEVMVDAQKRTRNLWKYIGFSWNSEKPYEVLFQMSDVTNMVKGGPQYNCLDVNIHTETLFSGEYDWEQYFKFESVTAYKAFKELLPKFVAQLDRSFMVAVND
jgi:hypothetical protein